MPDHVPSQGHSPRRCLVSGGAGFIGSRLSNILVSRGDHVTVVDDLSTGRRINLPEVHPRLRCIECDLARALETELAGETFDRVYHLAAAVGVQLIIADPIASIETNVAQAAAMLRFAAACGPAGSPAPILMASSSEVYGKSKRVPFAEDDDVEYGPTTKSRWSYAMSKALDEYLALAYHQKRGLPVVIARFFNTIGPGQVGDYGMVVPRFIEKALAGEPLEVYGDGAQTRCFCDVRDVAGVLPRLLECPAAHGRVFNIGSDRTITIEQLANLAIAVTGSKSSITRVRYTDAYAAGFEDLLKRGPDLTRIREAVGFEPTIPLERTLADVAAWVRGGKGPPMEWPAEPVGPESRR